MGWFTSSAPTASDIPPPSTLPSPKSASESTEKVKPCCVCKDEKAARDECMLFSNANDPQEDCKGLVGQYKECMKGFGFRI